MRYTWLLIALALLILSGCQTTTVSEEIEKVRIVREKAVIQVAKEYFLAAGGLLTQYPDLFSRKSNWKQRTEQARLVLFHLGQDETVPPSLVHRMTMYFSIMLSEASRGEYND